jgi:hypothetical protein
MGLDPVNHTACANDSEVIATSTTNDTALALDIEEYVGLYAHPVHGQLEIIGSNGQMRLLIGSVGNASIQCNFSVTKCELAFQGIWATSFEADGFRPLNQPYPLIHFWKNEGEHVHTISMPWYSDLLIEFHWAQPKSLGSRKTISSTFLLCSTILITVFY